ncbi:MAG: VWA domain-containing protein, partial [Acidobacteria bacterium]
RPAPRREARRRRLRNLVLLGLRVAALLLLAVSFARPYLAAGADVSSRRQLTVVALDVSASMSAPGVVEQARAAVRSAITTAPEGDAVALLTFADSASVLSPPTSDRGALFALADGIRPGAGGTSYAAALGRVAELVADGPGRVVIVTDMQRPGGRPAEAPRLAEGMPIEIVDVGSNSGNVAVVDVERRRHDQLVAVLRNTGREIRNAGVTLSIDGRVAARKDVTLPADGRTEVQFDVRLPERGSAAVGVEDGKGAALDDTRYLVLDPPAPPRVLVVGNGSPASEAFFVVRALGVGEGRLFDARSVGPSDLGRLADAREGDAYAAVVLLGTRGMSDAGRNYLRRYVEQGGGMLVAAGPALDAGVLEDLTGDAMRLEQAADRAGSPLSIVVTEGRHPAFRVLAAEGGFTEVRVTRASALGVAGGAETLARFTDGSAAIAQAGSGRGTVVAVASDLGGAWNDLPRSPSFLPLLHGLVRNLGAGRELPGAMSACDLPSGFPPTPGIVDMT